MKTVVRNILIGIVLSASAGQAFAYPPDNAAVLYYRAFMLMEEPNKAIGKMISDLRKGESVVNEQIRRYVERNRKAINVIVTATDIRSCDWGLDFSEGLELAMPNLAKCRQAAYMLATDAKVLAKQGDYEMALERCVVIHKMSIHVGDDTLVSCLVGVAIKGIANDCVVDILPRVSRDYELLQRLRIRLAALSSRHPSMRAALAKEAEIFGRSMNKEDIRAIFEDDFLDMPQDKIEELKQILQKDDEFFTRAREYYLSIMARVQSYFDLPYTKAMQEFEELSQEIDSDLEEKPESIISKVLFPAIGRVCSVDTRGRTHLNAVVAGVDICLIRAKTGELPNELPAGLPKDMFSGKDFLYEKTDAGFVLKCQSKDLSNDVVREFEFKVAK
jgi:hypothetical protein